MESPLDRIAFLARSGNRVQMLRMIAEENRTRHELREESALSRTTLGRVLNEFEDRDLITLTKDGYTTTPAADETLQKFIPLLETMEGIQNLGDAINRLPPPLHSVEVRYFRDAEITKPLAENPAASFDRMHEVTLAAEKYRGVSATAIPSYTKALRGEILQDRIHVEVVIPADFIEELQDDPERAVRWHDFAEAEVIWVYDGFVPINMHIVDQMVLVWIGELHDGEWDIYGLLESENPVVLSWAESLHEEFQSKSEQLDPEMLPEI